MKKTAYLSLVFGFAALMSAAPSANAQSYTYVPVPSYGVSTCLTLSHYLSLGSSDVYTAGQVTELQEFLNRAGYLQGVSGVFDAGTYGAVVNYQAAHGIPQTGTVGPITRTAINQQSCLAVVSPAVPITPIGYGNGGYPYQNGTTYGTGLTISSLSTTSGYPGQLVTIYGSNLLGSSPIIHFGNTTVNVTTSSYNSVSFVVPSYGNGNYPIYVSNGYGTSNSISFNVTSNNSSGNNCYYLGNTFQCGCNNIVYSNGSYNTGSNQCYNNGTNNISITSLSSTYGYAGQSITVYGYGFTSNNTVNFNNISIPNVYSNNGTSLIFTVPSNYTSGSYNVSVTNGNGVQSNSLTFNVSGSNNNCGYTNGYNNGYNNGSCSNGTTWYGGNGLPSISSITGSASVSTGTSNTFTVYAYDQNNLAANLVVDWGDNTATQNTQIYGSNSSQQYSFSHVYYTPGNYTIRMTITDSSGQYSYATFPVYVSGSGYNNGGSYGTPTISYLSSTSGYPGSTITIIGSNFTPNDTVYFGNGNLYNVTSFDGGTELNLTIPNVSPGTYPVYVTNSSGQTSGSTSYTLL